MICNHCQKQIPENSKFCNNCGVPLNGHPQIYFASDIANDRYEIAIETNDPVVIEACYRFHTELNYQMSVNETSYSVKSHHLIKDPNLLYFITEGTSDYTMLKALRLPDYEILSNRRNFIIKIRTFLVQNGYEQQPGAASMYIKRI